MKKTLFVIANLIIVSCSIGQNINQKLQQALQQFEADSQLRHAVSSLYVIDAKTGKIVFDKNSQVGLAPASTQKIITATTAFELLGKDYRYKTELGYDGKMEKGVLNGNLYFVGSGDPTLGSWRWWLTKDTFLMSKWWQDVKKTGIKRVDGSVWFTANKFSVKSIPDGWIWEDVGNYYGAGAYILNWKENQYDVLLRSSNEVGQPVDIISPKWNFVNDLKSASKSSGDNAYVYYNDIISGTIPINESSFKISAAQTEPIDNLCNEFSWYLNSKNVSVEAREKFSPTIASGIEPDDKFHIINTHYSPSLDSIIYWFLKKSINLYGEALVKTFSYEKQGFGSTDSGVAIVKDFWKQKGLDEHELNICDGSGLSPLNRVTTHSEVEVLKYAKTKDWFPYFYNALPEYNNMKMKSGTIRDVKSFCGYQTSKDGNEYIFSFIVNNYNGRSSELVTKMYKVLDNLK